jgi:hypothetical protein
MEKDMSKIVSWSEAFFFWFALFWRSIVLYLLIAFIIMVPLSFIFSNEHPAAVTGIGMIVITIIFWFAMTVPVKMVLQKFLSKKLLE